MDLKQLEDAIAKASTSEVTQTETKVETPEVAPQSVETPVEVNDSLKAELDKVRQKSSPKSEEEKAEYTFKSVAKRLQDLGKDPAELLGIKREEEVEEDEKPLTRKDLEAIMSKIGQPNQKSAIDMVNEISNETERELHQYYLENIIKPSGNPVDDFNNAKAIVESITLRKQLELQRLRPDVKTHSSASSVQINTQQVNLELSADEKMLLDHSKGLLTKDDIIASRKR